jgi:outer membrane protein assembly factor BamB
VIGRVAGIVACLVSLSNLDAAAFDENQVLGRIEPRIIRSTATYRHWSIRLPDAAPGSAGIELNIWTRGPKAVQLAARAKGLERWRDLELGGLSAAADSLRGKLVFHAHEAGGSSDPNWPTHRWTLALDLTAAGGRVTGSVTGHHAVAVIGKDITRRPDKTRRHVREVLEKREALFRKNSRTVQAHVTGWVRDSAARRAADPWPKQAVWTHWLGPDGSLRGASRGGSLVGDPTRAVLRWKAEPHLPNGGKGQVTRYGGFGSSTRSPSGGGSSPIVADGKVYLYWYEPSGPIYLTAEEEKRAPTGYFLKSMWQTLADDHIGCFDAVTGERLWEAVYPLGGMTFFHNKSCLINATPAVGEDALVAVGGSGRVYCLDPQTGTQRWQTLLPYHEQVTRRYALSGKGAGGRARPHAVTIAGGRAYVADESRGLIALDLKTGTPVWRRRSVLGAQVTPQVWRHGGVVLLLLQDDKGTVHALDPATGTDRWGIEGLPEHSYKTINNFVLGDMLLVQSAVIEGAPKGQGRAIAGYRISAAGAKKVWELPGRRYCWPHNGGAGSIAALDEHRAAILMGKSSGKRPGLPALIVVDVRDGRVLQERDDTKSGVTYNMSLMVTCGDLLVFHADINHNAQSFHGYRITPAGLDLLWAGHHFGHYETTSYETPTVNPFLDGRLFVRGAYGLYCYDFRAER